MSTRSHIAIRRQTRFLRPHPAKVIDPVLIRKGRLPSPGILLMAMGGGLFAAYIFNLGGVQTYLDGLFNNLDHTARSHNDEVAAVVVASLPYVGAGLAALLVLILFSGLARGTKKITRKRRLRSRDSVTLAEFAALAAEHGVSSKVSQEAYQQLRPFYYDEMRIRLSDDMRDFLHMSPIQISDLYDNLLSRTDRKRRVGEDGLRFRTVLDLIVGVEQCEVRSLTRSKLYRRMARDSGGGSAQIGSYRRSSLIEAIKRSGLRKAVTAAPERSNEVVRPRRLETREADMPVSGAPKDK